MVIQFREKPVSEEKGFSSAKNYQLTQGKSCMYKFKAPKSGIKLKMRYTPTKEWNTKMPDFGALTAS